MTNTEFVTWLKAWAAPPFDDERVLLGLDYLVGLRRAGLSVSVSTSSQAYAPLITGVLRDGGT